MTTVATHPAKNDPIAAIAERRAGLPLPGHLIAIDAGDHRGGLARQS